MIFRRIRYEYINFNRIVVTWYIICDYTYMRTVCIGICDSTCNDVDLILYIRVSEIKMV